MAQRTDWLSGTRTGQLQMARTWVSVFREDTTDAKDDTVQKYAAWGIPVETYTEFVTLFAAAEEALRKAQEQETRTPVTTAACKAAIDALIASMRQIKKRWLHIPPLTDADYISLGLTLPDTTHTVTGEPTAQVAADLYLTTGRHELGVKARYLKGSADERANKAYEYWYVTLAPGETAPETPSAFSRMFDTQRKNDAMPFEFSDSGKIAYVVCRVKNGKLKGPFGPIVSALIP